MEVIGDKVGNQAVKLQVKAAKLTWKVISEAIGEYIQKSQKGEMKIKKFKKEYGGKEIIPVNSIDINKFKKELKKEGIDFSVVKNKENKETYDLYFKGQDINQVKQALERFTKKTMKKPIEKASQDKGIKQEVVKENDSQDKENKQEVVKENDSQDKEMNKETIHEKDKQIKEKVPIKQKLKEAQEKAKVNNSQTKTKAKEKAERGIDAR